MQQVCTCGCMCATVVPPPLLVYPDMGWPLLVGSRATATTMLSDRMQALQQQAQQNLSTMGQLTPSTLSGPQNATAQFTGWSLQGLAVTFNSLLSFCFKNLTFFSYSFLLLALSPKIKLHLFSCTALMYFVSKSLKVHRHIICYIASK